MVVVVAGEGKEDIMEADMEDARTMEEIMVVDNLVDIETKECRITKDILLHIKILTKDLLDLVQLELGVLICVTLKIL